MREQEFCGFKDTAKIFLHLAERIELQQLYGIAMIEKSLTVIDSRC